MKTLQNFFKTTITTDWVVGTGNRYIATLPTTSTGWLVVSPNSTSLREIVAYTATGTDGGGNYITISARGVGGTTEQSHSIGESVRMNITAQHWADIYVDPTFTGTVTVPTPTNGTDAATKAYADGIAVAGGADASTTIKGISKMSVAPASAANPIAVGDNDTRMLTQGENDAAVGNNTEVAVGTGNKFVTQTGLQKNTEKYAADAGATDAYAITLSPVPASYTTGMVVYFTANTVNTGAATLNVNGLGAKTIVKGVNTTLADGDIATGQFVTVIYDGTNFVLQNPVATVPTSTFIPSQQLPFYTGTNTGLINTVQSNQTGSVFFNVYNAGGGTDVVLQRIISDAKTGQMYITHTATWTLTTGVIDSMQIGVTASYIYIWCRDNGTMKMNRYDVANLANATSMTISGATGNLSISGAGFSDGTNLYAYKGTVNTLQKYTISGTTATYSADISYTSADFASGGITCDGTYVYNIQTTTSAVVINKYALAGGAIISTTNLIINIGTYPNSPITSPSVHIRTPQVLGISYAHSITSATAIIGYVQEIVAITLP